MKNFVLKLSLPTQLQQSSLQCDVDAADEGENSFWAAGYCDDNSRFLLFYPSKIDGTEEVDWKRTAEEIVKKIEDSLNATGDLSLVTKLGRKGSKSVIELHNVPPQMHKHLPKSAQSIAWSHEKDGPHAEEVELRVHICDDIPAEVQQETTSNTPTHLNRNHTNPAGPAVTGGESLAAFAATCTEADKHLGTTRDMLANTWSMAEACIHKVKKRLDTLQLHRVRGKSLACAGNSMLCTVTEHAPLLNGLTLDDTQRTDSLTAKTLK
jgi:hypothetical protein